MNDKGEYSAIMDGEVGFFLPPEIINLVEGRRQSGKIVIEYDDTEDKFFIDVYSIEGAMDRLYARIANLSKQRRWEKSKLPDSVLKDLSNSIDQSFECQYCLISGVQSKLVANKPTE